MPEEPRPRSAFYDHVDEEPVQTTSPAPPQPEADSHRQNPQSKMPPTHIAGTVLPSLVALLVGAIGTAVGGMLLEGNDLAVVICALIGAVIVILSYLLPNGPLRRLSSYRWPMIATVATALVVPAAVVLLRNEQGIGYTLAIAAATALSCAVLIVAAFEVDIEDAITSCATLLGGVAVLLWGVANLIDGSSLVGVAFLLGGVAVLLWGVTALTNGSSIRALVLLGGVAVLLWGVETLIDGSSLWGVAVLLMGVAVLLMGVAFLIDGSSLMGVAFLLMGVAFLLMGVTLLIDGWSLMGVPFLLMGDTFLLWGVTALIDGSWLKSVAFLLLGVTALLVGVTALIDGSSLVGVAFLLIGVATLLGGVAILFRGSKATSPPCEGERSLVAYWFRAKE